MLNSHEDQNPEHLGEVSESCKLLVDIFLQSLGSINAQIIYAEWLHRNKGFNYEKLFEEIAAKSIDQAFSPAEQNYIVQQYLAAPTTGHRFTAANSDRILGFFVAYLEQTLPSHRSPVLSYQTRKHDFDLNQLDGMSEIEMLKILRQTAIVEHQLQALVPEKVRSLLEGSAVH